MDPIPCCKAALQQLENLLPQLQARLAAQNEATRKHALEACLQDTLALAEASDAHIPYYFTL
jgi:hypothetical protein